MQLMRQLSAAITAVQFGRVAAINMAAMVAWYSRVMTTIVVQTELMVAEPFQTALQQKMNTYVSLEILRLRTVIRTEA